MKFMRLILACSLLCAILANAQNPEGVITGDGVRMRSGPSTESNVLAVLTKGQRVQVERVLSSEPWARVYQQSNLSRGWVHTDFLKRDPWPIETKPAALDFADVLAWGGLPLQVAGTFPEGKVVRVLTEGQSRVFHGRSTFQGSERNECSGSDIPLTFIDMEPGVDFNLDPILAFVGGGEYKRLGLNDMPQGEALDALRAKVQEDKSNDENLQDFRTDKTRAYTVQTDAPKIHLIVEEQIDAGAPFASSKYVFIADEHIKQIYTGCATLPEFFQLGDDIYCMFKHGQCESDDYNKSVYHLGKDAISLVYHSNWFGC